MAEFVDKKEVQKLIDNVPSDLSYWAVTDGIIVIKPDAFDRMHKEIDRITKEDVAPVVHAKWKQQTGGGGFNEWVELKCYNCSGVLRQDGDIRKYKYCPFCGAVMDLED